MVENREIIPVSVSFRKTRHIRGRNFLPALLNSLSSGACMSPLDVFVAERHNFRRPLWMKNVGSSNATLLVWLIWLNGLEGSLSKTPEYRSFTVYVEGGWWDTSTEKVPWSQKITSISGTVFLFQFFFFRFIFKLSFFEIHVNDFSKLIYFNKFAFDIPLHCQNNKSLFIKMSSHHIWIFLYIINTFLFISAI